MAYTYNDFVTAATNAGLLDQFTDDDLRITQSNPEFGLSLLSLKQNYNNAQTDEQRLLASEAANQLRQNYATAQNSTETLERPNYQADAGTDNAGGLNYTSPYSQQIQDFLNQLNGYGDFDWSGNENLQNLINSISGANGMDYDHTQDPQWSAIKKQYLREGDRAIQDTLAKASAATGGRPSSYAVTAASLAGGNYAAQLADRIPTLYQQELQRRLSAIGALESDRNFQYQDWQNGYNMLQNGLNNALNMDQSEYSRWLQDFNNALTLYQTLGYATDEVAAILGIEANAPGGSNESNNYANPGGGGYTENPGWSPEKILQFQKEHGLTEDGVWGPETANAYDNDKDWVYDENANAYRDIERRIGTIAALGASKFEIQQVLDEELRNGRITQQQYFILKTNYL